VGATMVLFEKGEWYWLEHPVHAFVPVKLRSQKGAIIVAQSDVGEQFEIPATQELQKCHKSSRSQCENMVDMEELSEGAILHNLRLRFEQDQIYTYISSILVSVNPFKQLPIYSPAIMGQYRFAFCDISRSE